MSTWCKSILLADICLLVAALLVLPAAQRAQALPGDIQRASTTADGTEANYDSYGAALSFHGRYVAFSSTADNLAPGDINTCSDVFRKDLETGEILACSSSAAGFLGNDSSFTGSISDDGRYVAFYSYADNLVQGDANDAADVFRKDLLTGEIVLCSTTAAGTQGDDVSVEAAISSDGSYVAFASAAANLVTPDNGGYLDVFRKDLQTGQLVRCSESDSGVQANGGNQECSIDGSGTFVAFRSESDNLIAGDAGGFRDVFRKNADTGEVVRASEDSLGNGGNSHSSAPSISPDGNYVAFASFANNLVGVDTNAAWDVFLKDLSLNSVTLCSTNASGIQASGNSYDASVSLGGEYVSFYSGAANLVGGDTDTAFDVFRKNTASGGIELCSVSAASGQTAVDCLYPAISPDGRCTAFTSQADDLVPGDNAGRDDIFVKEWQQDAAYTNFHFAEGYTGTGFQEYLCIANPHPVQVAVQVTYLFDNGPKQVDNHTIPANSRLTIDVNAAVGPGMEVSANVTSDSPDLVAERPMYFDYGGGWTGGHAVMGSWFVNNSWYFAEGYTGAGFQEYILVQNTSAVTTNLTFNFQVKGSGLTVLGPFPVAGGSRATFDVNQMIGPDKEASLQLVTDQPWNLVVAERAMYFDYTGAGDVDWEGGHCVMGATSLSREFFFAEGTTRAGFDEYLCLQNPNAYDITVGAAYLMGPGQGGPVTESYTIPANQRYTVPVAAETGADKDVSVRLSSEAEFLAERPMYFSYSGGGGAWEGGHCLAGSTAPAHQWLFAEGYTGAGFDEWLCLQNPSAQDVQTEITYLVQGSGAMPPVPVTVPARSRMTIKVNDQAGAGKELSTLVHVTEGPGIVAERPMYFNYNGAWDGGSDAAGWIMFVRWQD